ncbi:hypothetical protein BDF14DRAFT_1111896 [Spinellus fusiger]|nr:hypothetical protein BDF14DRAFT_1111896 [Spinellus fusiger]
MEAIDSVDKDMYTGLLKEDKKMMDKVLKSGGDDVDIGKMMVAILTEQLELKKTVSANNDTYKMLNAFRCMLEAVENWKEKDSELTCYRRCATMLDYVFSGSKLCILDGEPGCLATKEHILLNHSLYPLSEDDALSTSAIRKVDAIVVTYEKKEMIELSTNEWKKASATQSIAMKQQSKNLRTNLTILNQLKRRYSIKTKNVVAMDFVGSTGYMYSLEEKNGVHIANLVKRLLLPTSKKEIKHIPETINTLFKFKVR